MKALLAPHTCLRLTNATLVDAVQCVTMITAYSTELPGAFLLTLTGIGKVPLWRNWQTRQTQNLFPATEWEFESPWGHHLPNTTAQTEICRRLAEFSRWSLDEDEVRC